MNDKGIVGARVLFETPQCEIASLISCRLDECESASLVAGFVTADGIDAISEPLVANPDRLELLLIGAGTHKAFEACDRLIEAGVEREHLQVHLGFTRKSGGGFAKYHPMLHSKVYLMEMTDGRTCAFIGSHNLTGFAIGGLNGEASVLLEGPSSAKEFDAVRAHIREAANQAVQYDPSMKDAYNWWAVESLGGLKNFADDRPKDVQGSRTIVVLAECPESGLPGYGEIVYFEIPEAIRAMGIEVHLFLFDKLPSTSKRALNELDSVMSAFRGRVVGLEDGGGGLELLADWQVHRDHHTSKLAPTVNRRVQCTPLYDMQQVRVELHGKPDGDLVYRPDKPQRSWVPVFDEANERAATEFVAFPGETGVQKLAPGAMDWQRVIGLHEAGERMSSKYQQALIEMSPEAGSYTLMLRRLSRLKERE